MIKYFVAFYIISVNIIALKMNEFIKNEIKYIFL